MRLHRIHVENFKSISQRTLELPDCGLVIAEGLNEVGKTSMVEALDLLLDARLKATSKAGRIKAAQPYGTDLPVVVEAEMTVDGVRLVHSKRFLVQPAARLEFLSGPRAGDVLTGEEATDTMAEVWKHTDETLWGALRLMQASSLESLSLKSSTALTAALDRASRQGSIDDRAAGNTDDTSLLDAVEAEYAEYWTGTGKAGKALKDADHALEEARGRRDEAERELQEVDVVVADLETAREDQTAQQSAVAELKKESARDDDALEALKGLEQEVERARRAEHDAALREQSATAARDARAVADEEAVDAAKEATSAKEQADTARAAADDVEEEYRLAEKEWEGCEAARTRARSAWKAARDLVESLRRRARFGRLEEAVGRLLGMQSRLRDAEARLRANLASDAGVKAAEKAATTLASARTKLDVTSPRMTITRLADDVPALTVDGEPLGGRALSAGSPGPNADGVVEKAVDRRTIVEVSDAWRIAVTPASDVGKLALEVERARRALADALEPMAVESLEEARELLADRRADANAVKGLRERLQQELDGVDLADLGQEEPRERTVAGLVELRGRLAAQLGKAPGDAAGSVGTATGEEPGSAADGDPGAAWGQEPGVGHTSGPEPEADAADELTAAQAEDRAAACERAHEEAERSETSARAARDAVGRRRGAARETASGAASALEAATGQADRLATRLAEARIEASDDELSERAAAQGRMHGEAERVLTEVSARLEEHSPGAVRAAAEDSRLRLDKAIGRLGKSGTRASELDGQLRGMGRAKRQDSFDGWDGKVHRLEIEATAVHKRANAARLLRDTLVRHRDEQRRRYLEPFTREIERLGRNVFGADLAVRVDDSLTVTQRRLGGKWLDWEQLSTGAKEQLGLVVRLATARLVSADDGVPVILDDALVYSDRVRTRRMLQEVAGGSHTSQVVVFTSAPERYDTVEAVRVEFE